MPPIYSSSEIEKKKHKHPSMSLILTSSGPTGRWRWPTPSPPPPPPPSSSSTPALFSPYPPVLFRYEKNKDLLRFDCTFMADHELIIFQVMLPGHFKISQNLEVFSTNINTSWNWPAAECRYQIGKITKLLSICICCFPAAKRSALPHHGSCCKNILGAAAMWQPQFTHLGSAGSAQKQQLHVFLLLSVVKDKTCLL